MGTNLIACQAFLNFFKQPNEAWALFKRTGMPNRTTVLANEDIRADGSIFQIPRRAVINPPASTEINRVNRQAAIDEMMKDPDFGDPLSPFGRVWWDRR
ncbi:MAG: SusD/RagB family nutrient-binding outer membrane lipoprotein [Bacteroidetes bacterium]|nr:MAG: SusD/RagB family nutrient-binding outer membrane lipoprotein [Bacteroidota bacterium]